MTSEVHPPGCVWRTRPLPTAPSDGDWASLSERDRQHAGGISHPAARTRFVVGRALLRATVAELAPEFGTADPIELEVASSGRLGIAGRADLQVSVSHTRGLAAAAGSSVGGIGIDVEPIVRGDLPPTHVWLTDEEERRLSARCPQARRRGLLRLWVAKEAAIKAGDRAPPVTRRTIEVDEHRRCVVRAATATPLVEQVASISWFLVADRYLLALASSPVPAVTGPTALTMAVGSGAR